jgi:hypothetical protein
MAGSFHITGQAQMITPPLLSQYGADNGDACTRLTTVSGMTVAGLQLDVHPLVDATGAYPCSMAVTLGGQPVPDTSGDGFGSDGKKYDGDGFAAVGAYVIGGTPHALAIVSIREGFAADHEGDYLFQLYVVRDRKPLEVFRADSKDTLDVSVRDNVLTFDDVNRVHGDECEACTTPESMSFDIDPKTGRVHWHAPAPRAAESVEYWLKEADPAFRAQEAQASQQEEQQLDQEEQARLKGWYILNRDNECVSAAGATPDGTPASLITFDLDQGLRDEVIVTQRDDSGNPIGVEVGEPQAGDMVSTYQFYKGLSNCNTAANAAVDALKGLN